METVANKGFRKYMGAAVSSRAGRARAATADSCSYIHPDSGGLTFSNCGLFLRNAFAIRRLKVAAELPENVWIVAIFNNLASDSYGLISKNPLFNRVRVERLIQIVDGLGKHFVSYGGS